MSAEAAAFAALEAIEAGEWDRFLLRLRAAIEQRRKTDEYKEHIMAAQLFPPPGQQRMGVTVTPEDETRLQVDLDRITEAERRAADEMIPVERLRTMADIAERSGETKVPLAALRYIAVEYVPTDADMAWVLGCGAHVWYVEGCSRCQEFSHARQQDTRPVSMFRTPGFDTKDSDLTGRASCAYHGVFVKGCVRCENARAKLTEQRDRP